MGAGTVCAVATVTPAASTNAPNIDTSRIMASSSRNLRSFRSFDDLIRPQQQRARDGHAERLRGLEIEDQLELGGLLDGQIGRPGALENFVHVDGGAPEQI